MATGWTPERRARQGELIRQWRPWEKSTGPKTEAGKRAVSQNAYKGGTWRLLRELSRALRKQKRQLAGYDPARGRPRPSGGKREQGQAEADRVERVIVPASSSA